MASPPGFEEEDAFVGACRGVGEALRGETGPRWGEAWRRTGDAGVASGKLVRRWATASNLRDGWDWTVDGSVVLLRDLKRARKAGVGVQGEGGADTEVPSLTCLLWFGMLVLNTVPITFLFVPLLRAALGEHRDSIWLPDAFSPAGYPRRAAVRRLRGQRRSHRRNHRT